MNSNQENKMNMYESVTKVLDQYKTTWNTYAPIADEHSQLLSKLQIIRQYRLTQERDTIGITIDTHVLGTNLINAALKVIAALVAHASLNNDNELKQAVNFTKSQLLTCRDNILVDRVNLVYNTALPLTSDLALWNITPVDISTLSSLNSQYESAIPSKRAAVSGSKTATLNISTTFREIDTLLKHKLDSYLLIFQTNNPDFYNTYKAARMIIDLGIRHEGGKTGKITGSVIHFTTEEPISGALVTLIEKGLTFTTSSDGRFNFTIDTEGNYTLKAEKQGFITYTEDAITVAPGDQVNVEIELEPNE